jgi:hypothetical protein
MKASTTVRVEYMLAVNSHSAEWFIETQMSEIQSDTSDPITGNTVLY